MALLKSELTSAFLNLVVIFQDLSNLSPRFGTGDFSPSMKCFLHQTFRIPHTFLLLYQPSFADSSSFPGSVNVMLQGSVLEHLYSLSVLLPLGSHPLLNFKYNLCMVMSPRFITLGKYIQLAI